MSRMSIVTMIALGLLCPAAKAQTYTDANGTVVAAVAPIPFPYFPVPPGQYNLAPRAATSLSVPAGARLATLCASSATVRYTTDGVTLPTSTVGMPLVAGACLTLSGPAVLATFRAISAAGILDVEYFK